MLSFFRNKNKLVLIITLLIIAIISFIFSNKIYKPINAQAHATYYISPTGSDTVGNGTYNNPWATLKKAFLSMFGGDTLIVKDGTYTGSLNIIDNNYKPPNGSLSAYTTLKAENMGKAIIDGEGVRQPVSLRDVSYIIFDGLIFKNSSGTVFSLTGGAGGSTFSHHIKIMRCGFADAADNGQAASGDIVFFRYVNYSLIEDSYTWGNGRYRFYILDSNHIILRRCVDRPDRGVDVGYSNQGSFRLYGASNSLLQNCISINSNFAYRLTPSGGNLIPASPKIFWIGPNSSTGFKGENNKIEGIIGLNTGRDLLGFIGNYDVSGNVLSNSVFWDSDNALWTRSENQADRVYVSHCTFGQIDDPSGYHDHAAEADVYGLMEVKDSLIYGSGDSGLRNVISDYNALYGNKYNYQGSSAGSHDICSENSNAIDPIDGNPGNGIPTLKYLCRIEKGSNLDGAANDGGDIGATILKKVGVSGTLYGESGYNDVTSESLWPFPNENLIREKMKAYFGGGVSGNRGFASDGNGLYGGPITLTSYIWEYLGNPCPSDICNYGLIPEPKPEPEPEPIVPPSITLTKQAGQSQASSGYTLTYTITYQNTSTVEAKNIIITDKIPEGATYIEASATNGGIYNSGANELTWIISSLPAGASGQVSFQAKVD